MIQFGIFFILAGVPTMLYLHRNRRRAFTLVPAFAWALGVTIVLWLLTGIIVGMGRV